MIWFILKDNNIIFVSHQRDILYFYVIKFRVDFLSAYAFILSLHKEKSSSFKCIPSRSSGVIVLN